MRMKIGMKIRFKKYIIRSNYNKYTVYIRYTVYNGHNNQGMY